MTLMLRKELLLKRPQGTEEKQVVLSSQRNQSVNWYEKG
jgi:hypothetical protein